MHAASVLKVSMEFHSGFPSPRSSDQSTHSTNSKAYRQRICLPFVHRESRISPALTPAQDSLYSSRKEAREMNFYKWLTVIGGVLTLCGILTAFIWSKYTRALWVKRERASLSSLQTRTARNGKKRNAYFGGLTSPELVCLLVL